MARARAAALRNLAAEISVTIQGELTSTEQDSARGDVETTLRSQITEIVESDLRGVELVDWYHTAEDGYWFYYRLSKESWRNLQDEEMRTLRVQIVDRVRPVFEESTESLVEEIMLLSSALKTLRDSPFTGRIEATLNDETGILEELIDRRLRRSISTIELRVIGQDPTTTPSGSFPIRFVADVRNPDGAESEHPTGPVPVKVTSVGERIVRDSPVYVTDVSGEYNGRIELGQLPAGVHSVCMAVALDELGCSGISIAPPQLAFSLRVEPIEVTLHTHGAANQLAGFHDQLAHNLSFNAPIAFSEPGHTELTLDATVSFRDVPENPYGVFISYAVLNLSFAERGTVVEQYTSPEVKGAGLDYTQAHENALVDILDALGSDPEFVDALNGFVQKVSDSK